MFQFGKKTFSCCNLFNFYSLLYTCVIIICEFFSHRISIPSTVDFGKKLLLVYRKSEALTLLTCQ